MRVARRGGHLVVEVVSSRALVLQLAGPRGSLDARDLAWGAAYPAIYVAWTLVHGEVRGFWLCPFTDVDRLGIAHVALHGLAVVVLFVVVSLGARWLDRRSPDPTSR